MLLFVLLSSSFSFAAGLPALKCSVTGAQLANKKPVTDKLVSAKVASTLSLVLGEDQSSGTYMTYVKLDLAYHPEAATKLVVSAKPTYSKTAKITMTSNMSAELEFSSRLNRPNMKINVSCQATNLDYLLVPKYNQFPDDFLDFQNVATTLPVFANDRKTNQALHPYSDSESEFLAAHFCADGDMNKLLNDFTAAPQFIDNFWQAAALNKGVLAGQNIKLSAEGLSWQQPVQSATCVKSHEETQDDPDGGGLTRPLPRPDGVNGS